MSSTYAFAKRTKPKVAKTHRKPDKKGAGKRKGSAFEREICKRLSLWVSGGKKTDLFWRSAMSGGRATVARKSGKVVRQSGDITATTPEGHALTDEWYIECKSYKNIDLGSFVVTGKGKLAEWWKRCRKEARQYGKDPMLIAKQNGWPVLVITPYNRARLSPGAKIYGANCDITWLEYLVSFPWLGKL